MRAILPGKPQAKLQAVCTGQWKAHRIVVYVTANTLVFLTGPNTLLQTIYLDDNIQLEAVALDEVSGKIATCSANQVLIYKPYGEDDGDLKWTLQYTIDPQDQTDEISGISWGSSEELLISSGRLMLWTTAKEPSQIWDMKLANRAKLALFSNDSNLIASTGQYDRLVKIWRRLSFGWNDVRFDFAYLPHPQTVVGLRWRRPFHQEQTIENVLYTICSDNVLRIWAPTDPHGLQILQLWSHIDLEESLNPRLFGSTEMSSVRYAFIIDNGDFSMATERAKEADDQQNPSHVLEHIVEIANRSPEVCVVLDDKGRMSAWGLENVGSKITKVAKMFNVAHVKGLDVSFLRQMNQSAQLYNFCGDRFGQPFNVLIHQLDGSIFWMEAKIDELFNPSPSESRWTRRGTWDGHTHPVKKIVRSATGKTLVSRTSSDCAIGWIQSRDAHGLSLRQKSQIQSSEHIHRMCILDNEDYVVLLHSKKISVWDTQATSPKKTVADATFDIRGSPLCLVVLPQVAMADQATFVATVSDKLQGIVWEISIPPRGKAAVNGITNGSTQHPRLREFSRFSLNVDIGSGLEFVLPVDPAGSSAVISGFLDTFARDVIIAYTKTGTLRAWTARVDRETCKVAWLVTSTIETGIEDPSLASATSIRKTALVDADRTGLSLWDMAGQQLEFEETFSPQESIQDLDWTSTPDNQSILAVGFQYKVVMMVQLRYSYINESPAWAKVRELQIRDMTPHPIGDSVWLSGGDFAIGAGNQMFVYGREVDSADILLDDKELLGRPKPSMDLFGMVTQLNGTLPVYHPQFVAQAVLSGKVALAQEILLKLHKTLKFWTEGDNLDSLLEIPVEDFTEDATTVAAGANRRLSGASYDVNGTTEDDEVEVWNDDIASSLTEKLTKTEIPHLTGQEQLHLAGIVESAATAERHRRALDDNAYRYLLFFSQHQLRERVESHTEPGLSWRELVWAFHSTTQDILVDQVSKYFQGRMLWKDARDSGMFVWLRDLTSLRQQMEAIAKSQYTQTDEKNPVDCSLFYLALRKKNVLLGLWRMASWNREQASTQRLLGNNFQEAKWKTAALKNAYVLLGKHRFEYAAAFFLLADCPRDAANVCANQMNDLQLAIAIARVYDGDDSPVLKELIEERVLPEAVRLGDRWLATWAFWMLNRRDMAVRSLISPLHTLLDSPASPNLQSKLFRANDPALVVMYRQLREKTLQTLKGATRVSPRAEWEFVMQNARLYDRMGCDLLALDLVKNWEFMKIPVGTKASEAGISDPRSLLRRRSSLVIADMPIVQDVKSPATPKKPAPTVFEEPSESSLLDSFGF